MAKNDTFPLITIHPLFFSETRSKCGGNCTKYKTTVTDLGKILVRVPQGHLGLKTPLFWAVFSNLSNYWYVCFLVVFHGAELENKCFNPWNCTVRPFSVGFTTLEAFFRAKPGWWWNVGLRIFQKKFQEFFAPKFIFIWCRLNFHCFFLFWFIQGGLGRVETWSLFRDFRFFTYFLNLIMHIGGPLSFWLVFGPPTLVGIGTLEFTLVRPSVRPENSQWLSVVFFWNFAWSYNFISVSYTHLTLPTIA